MQRYFKLFEPFKTKKLELKNRFVVPAMETNLGGLNGEITPELIGYWEARAKGGFGLLILENSSVDPSGNVCLHTPGFFDESCVPGLLTLTDAVHKFGAKMVAQISHSGRQTLPGVLGMKPVSASPIPCPLDRAIPRELTKEEINDLIERYASAAKIAQMAGFDAVEIHGAHGYLIAQFMSAYVNKRVDEFGGGLKERMRFPLEIIRRTREKVGEDYPLLFRFSADERIPGGRTLQESVIVAKMLEKAGIDILDVSTGVSGSGQYISAPAAVAPGYLLEEAAAIRSAVSIPVIVAGRLNDPDLAEYALEAGKADLIAIGRGSLAEPEFPNKLASGEIEDIAPCVVCLQGCYRAFPKPGQDGHIKYTTTCLVNRFCCAETKMLIKGAAVKKKVVIIGAGPAGLESAWVAAAQGHDVTVYEKEKRIGGQLYYAAIPPFKQELVKITIFQKRRCDRYNVSFKMETEAAADMIIDEKPDAVIVATGGTPIIPRIEGLDGKNICTSLEILGGEVMPGHNVLIVGGNLVGCEVADYLGEHLHKVTLVEMTEQIAREVPMQNRPFLFQRLQQYGVSLHPSTKVIRFTANGIVAEHAGQEVVMEGFDTIVLAMGTKPYNPLECKLEGKVPQLFVIGDAAAARQALEAIEEGAKTALEL